MPSTREETIDGNSGAFGNRCMTVCGTLCIIVATVVFFVNISLIVWLFEYKYPVKFSVICFMAALGVLYLTSFTSGLLLITKWFPHQKRSMINASEESMAGFTQRERTRESYEMTTNISYRENPDLLQLPQKEAVRKTPPPPYNSANARNHTVSRNELGEDQIQTDDGLTANRTYYVLEENNVHRNEEMKMTPRLINDDGPVQAQTSPKWVASLDRSSTSSNEIKQQRAANSQFLLQAQEQATKGSSQSSFREEKHVFMPTSTNPESSPKPLTRVKRNPSTALKRKLNTRMSMSQSDLDSETITGTSASNSNSEMHSNFNLDGSSQVSQSNWNAQVRASHSNLNPEITPRFSRRNADVRTSHLNLKPPVIPRTSQSSWNIEKSLPNSNPENKKPASLSNLNTGRQQVASKSNWLLPTDKQFTYYSNSNMNSDPSQSNSNSEAQPCASRMNTNYNISLGNSSSNISDVDTNSKVKNLKKMYQPEQFVARSKDAPSLHKARSFGSLTANASNAPQMGIGEIQTVGEVNASANNYNSYVSGRSNESGLDALKNPKKMTPQEWMSAWNHGVHKLHSTEAERIVGVRL